LANYNNYYRGKKKDKTSATYAKFKLPRLPDTVFLTGQAAIDDVRRRAKEMSLYLIEQQRLVDEGQNAGRSVLKKLDKNKDDIIIDELP